MKRRLFTVALAMALVVASVGLITQPVAAGTLNSTSWAISNNQTSTVGTRYDWGFTPSTTATVSRVSMSVPAGTSCNGTRYMALHNVSGNYATTPDVAAQRITGDIDIRARIAPDSWSATSQTLAGKWISTGNNFSYLFVLGTGGGLYLYWWDGAIESAHSNALSLTDGSVKWVRTTMSVATGAVNFYTSDSNGSWVQYGSTVTHGATSIAANTAPLTVGQNSPGITGNTGSGKFYNAEVRNGINGTVVASFDASLDSVAGSSWVASTGETWTLGRTGSDLPADIACDLTVSTVSGLPAGGAASVRETDKLAVYRLVTPTSLSATSTLGLTGFTNTGVRGSYRSTITTFDNVGPTAIDSALSPIVWIGPLPGNLTASSLQLSDPSPGASSVTYTFTQSSVTTTLTKCIAVLFSQTASGGGAPGGMGIASAAFGAASNYIPTPVGWTTTPDSSYGLISLVNASGQTPASSSGRTLVLTGLSNPSAPATYFAGITTSANSDCATSPIDSTEVAFSIGSGVVVAANIDPALTFAVSGFNSGTCNGTALTAASSTPTAVPLGHIGVSNVAVAGQTLTVSTNAANGYTTYIRYTGPFTTGVKNMPDWSGTNATPTTFASAGTEAFGYTTDSNFGGASTRFQSNKWAGLSTSPQPVQSTSGPTAGDAADVCFQMTTAPTTPAGSYSTTVLYTVVPSF